MNVSKKICAVIAGPTLAFSAMAGFSIHRNLQLMDEVRVTGNDALLLQATLELVDELQKERGRSVAFLGGGIEKSELEGQRKQVAAKLPKFKSMASASAIGKSATEKACSRLEALEKLRGKVDTRQMEKKEVIAAWTSAISELLQLEMAIADSSRSSGLPLAIRSISAVELAKENAGLLRANMMDTLTSGGALDGQQARAMISLKESVVAILGSPLIAVSAESKEALQAFLDSNHWRQASREVEEILKKPGQGHFNQDPRSFWNEITAAIQTLMPVLSNEVERISQHSAETARVAKSQLAVVSSVIVLLLAGIMLGACLVIRSITRPIADAISALDATAADVGSASQELYASSLHINTTSGDSASATQEAVAMLGNISSMISENVQSTQTANFLTKANRAEADAGQAVVGQMIGAICEIDMCSAKVMEEMKESSRKFSGIVNTIREIGAKTNVINDIVFQTKLLSFNASVEAARAGEHGRGFAVVAAEIGQLAAMSGRAAREITDLLESGVHNVEATVNESIQAIESLMSENKQKINSGMMVASECQAALDRMVESIAGVDSSLSGMSKIAEDQQGAVSEINSAVKRLDESSSSNALAADQATSAAGRLDRRANDMISIVKILTKTVFGDEGISASPPVQDEADAAEHTADVERLAS